MKTFPRMIAAAFLLFALTTTVCRPVGNGSIAVWVTIVPTEGVLHIVGFKQPEKAGEAPKVVLQNDSQKAIADFEVLVLMGNPRATSDGGEKQYGLSTSSDGRIPPLWPDERAIPPNASQEAHESSLEGHNLAHSAVMLHSDCLHAAVLINKVKFADGTTWFPDITSEQRQKLWRESIRPESASSCGSLSQSRDSLDTIKGFGFAQGMPTHADTKIVTYYSFSCPIRTLGGTTAAICPM
jgi:hypothetical protein